MRAYQLLSLALLLTSCAKQGGGENAFLDSSSRLSEIELDTQEMKERLADLKIEQRVIEKKLATYTSNLDSLQKQGADAKAIESIAREAKEKADSSYKSAGNVVQLKENLSHALRLLERTEKKVQSLETHLQSYWGKIDNLLALKHEMSQIKEEVHSKKAAVAKGELYRVEPGDSLDYIGRKFGVAPSEIARINNMSDESLVTGQKLNIPKN